MNKNIKLAVAGAVLALSATANAGIIIPAGDWTLDISGNADIDGILEADAIFAVFYDSNPINLRTLNSLVNYPGPKYKKVSFSNSGHAFNLAERLNKLFKTDKFQVYELTQGKIVTDKSADGSV